MKSVKEHLYRLRNKAIDFVWLGRIGWIRNDIYIRTSREVLDAGVNNTNEVLINEIY